MGGVQKDLAETLPSPRRERPKKGYPSLVSARRDSRRDERQSPSRFFLPPFPFTPSGCLRFRCSSFRSPCKPRPSRKRAITPMRDAAESLPEDTEKKKKSEGHYFSLHRPGISRAILLGFHPFNFLPQRSLGDSPRGCFHRRVPSSPFRARHRAQLEMCMYIIYI